MFKPFVRRAATEFRARSSERDAEIDRRRERVLEEAIASVIADTTKERDGLAGRIDDALARAALLVGNEVDEHLTRDLTDNGHLRALEDDVARGQSRLRTLEEHLVRFNRLQSMIVDAAPAVRAARRH